MVLLCVVVAKGATVEGTGLDFTVVEVLAAKEEGFNVERVSVERKAVLVFDSAVLGELLGLDELVEDVLGELVEEVLCELTEDTGCCKVLVVEDN